MKLTNKRHNELAEKLADELIFDSIEKQATVKEHITGSRDFSNEDTHKTKIMKDRLAPGALAALPLNILNGVFAGGIAAEQINNIAKHGVKGALRPTLTGTGAGLAGLGTALAINNARGKRMSEKNNTDWTKGDVAKSTFLSPFITPDSITKKRVRNAKPTQEEIVEKAASMLIESIMAKEAYIEQAENADIYAEASEKVLNSFGYSMFK